MTATTDRAFVTAALAAARANELRGFRDLAGIITGNTPRAVGYFQAATEMSVLGEVQELAERYLIAREGILGPDYVEGLIARAAAGSFAAQQRVFQIDDRYHNSGRARNLAAIAETLGLGPVMRDIADRMFVTLDETAPGSKAAIGLHRDLPVLKRAVMERLMHQCGRRNAEDRAAARLTIVRFIASPSRRPAFLQLAMDTGNTGAVRAIWNEFLTERTSA
jgi:hypothetical protein